MADDKKLREELLKQNGIVPGRIPLREREQIWQMIAKDKARVRRMKWAAIITWLLVPLLLIVGGIAETLGANLPLRNIGMVEAVIVACQAIVFVAIIFTISYFMKA